MLKSEKDCPAADYVTRAECTRCREVQDLQLKAAFSCANTAVRQIRFEIRLWLSVLTVTVGGLSGIAAVLEIISACHLHFGLVCGVLKLVSKIRLR